MTPGWSWWRQTMIGRSPVNRTDRESISLISTCPPPTDAPVTVWRVAVLADDLKPDGVGMGLFAEVGGDKPVG